MKKEKKRGSSGKASANDEISWEGASLRDVSRAEQQQQQQEQQRRGDKEPSLADLVKQALEKKVLGVWGIGVSIRKREGWQGEEYDDHDDHDDEGGKDYYEDEGGEGGGLEVRGRMGRLHGEFLSFF